MDSTLHITTDFAAVYLLNGLFTDNAAAVRHSDKSVMYVTALPLDAMLLPYTVKLCGDTIATNAALCRLVRLNNGELLLHLKSRHNYVYSASRPPAPQPMSAPAAFFDAVKKNNMAAARTMLTPELSESVGDAALTRFFEPYDAIYRNDGYLPAPDGSYILADENKGDLYVFKLKNGLIDNIVETE